jgi:hypothetical protein
LRFVAGTRRARGRRSNLPDAVKDDVERALGNDLGVELFKRTGGGVARIGEKFLAGGFALDVQFFKSGERQKDFTADFE